MYDREGGGGRGGGRGGECERERERERQAKLNNESFKVFLFPLKS